MAEAGTESLDRDRRRLMIAGLLLLAGAGITLSLHAAGAPEAMLDFLYDKLLSGLDVPPHPSRSAKEIVAYVSLIGGIAELLGGLALVGVSLARSRDASRRARLAR
jgi:hypothetical protein